MTINEGLSIKVSGQELKNYWKEMEERDRQELEAGLQRREEEPFGDFANYNGSYLVSKISLAVLMKAGIQVDALYILDRKDLEFLANNL